MTIRDYLGIIRERWLIIVLAILLGAVGALAVYLVRPAEYTADVSLYVSAQSGDNPQQAYQGAQLSEQRVKSYNELVTGNRVMTETLRRLNLSRTPEQLANQVAARSALDSVIINISVSAKSPEEAALIANTVATVTTQVVDELERPSAPNAVSPVAVRIVQPASAPDRPSSVGPLTTVLLGLFLGLVFGLAAAFVRNALDASVKTVETLAKFADAPNLAVLAFDPTAAKNPLTVHGDPQSPRSEAFRQLRTNLQFIDVDVQSKVILVTSPLPGEGKTTTVANLAIALAAAGRRVLVVEGDLRRPKLSEILGLDRSIGLTRILTGQVTLARTLQTWGGGAFDVLASGPTPPNPSELLSSKQMAALLREVRSMYDVVLVDSPPLLPVADAAAIAPATDGALLICRFKKTTRAQIQAAASALRAVSVDVLGTVFSMVPDGHSMTYARYNIYYSKEVAGASKNLNSTSETKVPTMGFGRGQPGQQQPVPKLANESPSSSPRVNRTD